MDKKPSKPVARRMTAANEIRKQLLNIEALLYFCPRMAKTERSEMLFNTQLSYAMMKLRRLGLMMIRKKPVSREEQRVVVSSVNGDKSN